MTRQSAAHIYTFPRRRVSTNPHKGGGHRECGGAYLSRVESIDRGWGLFGK